MIVYNLRNSRENLELKQKDIAKMLGVHFATVSGWETGKDTIPLERLVEYANKFNFSLDYLFGLSNVNQNYIPLKLDLNIIAHNLRKFRKDNKMTQLEVAQKINTTQAAYAHYENAVNLIPTSFLFNLTKVYKPFSIDELLGRKKQ